MHTTARPLTLYASQGLMTDPREHTALFSALPDELPSRCKIMQGLFAWEDSYGVSIPPEREKEII